MADATRLSQLVGAGGRSPGLEEFGQALRALMQTHPDLASEDLWQACGQLIAAHWSGLCREQPALSSWGMLVKCSETIARLRRTAAQDKGTSAADALAEFRAFMHDVTGRDDQA